MKPREAAPELLQVMRDWLKDNVEREHRELTMQHVKCKLFVELANSTIKNKPDEKQTD